MKKYGGGYENKPSIFDEIKKNDIIIAFFPCTRFEAKIPLLFRGEAYQQSKWSDRKKLEYAMKLHKELHENYMLISKLVCICLDRGLQMIIENPYIAPHYLTTYWCIKPTIIDNDRRENGDYMKKPTQYFFINCKPKYNIIFEPITWVEQRTVAHITKRDTGLDRQIVRSQIHPQYANRFIRQYILEKEGVKI